MSDVSDMELLWDYERQGSEPAFAALVQRHVNLVYSVAFRHTGIAAHAEEITQAVFVILARKAGSLRAGTILEGWLHETTRLTALSFRRGERRRQFREQEAYMQSTQQESAETSTWNQLAPLLDEALARLGKKDRDAVMLRFFKDQSLREVSAALNITEAAAQSRVHRAVEKLRRFLMKRGVVMPAAILTTVMAANSVQAAPVALATSVTVVAAAKGTAASASTLTLIQGALKIMAWTKVKTAVMVGACVLLTAGTTTIIISNWHRPLVGIPKNWTILSGTSEQWNWATNAIHGQSASGDTMLTSTNRYKDVTISAIVSATTRDADLVVRMQDADNGYVICYAPDGTPWAADNGSHIQLRKRVAGVESDVATFTKVGLSQKGKLTVVAKGPHIDILWNDKTVLKVNDATFASGYVGVRVYGDAGLPSNGSFSKLTVY